jgi:hypothetical protein
MSAEQIQTSEQKMDAILNATPWRCFHCDFITSDRAEAEAHNSIYDVFCVYDSMEGRAITAKGKLAAMKLEEPV